MENDFEIENSKLLKYNGTETNVVIPEGITTIAENVFQERSDIKDIKLPSSLVNILDNAFDGTNIKGLYIPENVKWISEHALYNMHNLEKIQCSENNAEYRIENGMLLSDKTLIKICEKAKGDLIIPEGVNYLWYESCSGLTEATSVTIPEGVTGLEENCFLGCGPQLKFIDCPDSITDIYEYALNPDKNTVIRASLGSFADSYCKAFNINCDTSKGVYYEFGENEDGTLEIKGYYAKNMDDELTLPEYYANKQITSIGESAFEYNSNDEAQEDVNRDVLRHVIIPEGYKTIKAGAFYNCSGLKWVDLPDSLEFIEEGAFLGTGLRSVNIPSHVKLDSDIFPESVLDTEIPPTSDIGSAFSGTSISEITIPEGYTSLDYYAFNGCESLYSVTLPASLTEIGEDAFCGCSEDLTIHAPKGSYAEQYAKENDIPFEEL